MNNRISRVVTLVSTCFLIYLLLSVMDVTFGWKWEAFNKVNLVSEIFKNDKKDSLNIVKTPEVKIETSVEQDFNLYKKPHYIINFYKGDSIVALPILAEKLNTLKQTGKGKIRIAYFGDSMIEGDLISSTFRQLFQKDFGGSGVGFLPINSNVAGFRQTANISASGWKDTNFMSKGAKNMYISGYSFTGSGSGTYRDNTFADVITEKSIIFGKVNNGNLTANSENINLNGNLWVNRKVIAKNTENSIKIKSNSPDMPLYGVSFESENGVIVDNFSFRGITGVELAKIDVEFLQAVQAENPYDLIILQYGVNLLFRAKDTDYSYYEKMIQPVLSNIKKSFPNTDILLVSAADRAFRYDGEYQTAIGLPNLIELQAKLAHTNGLAFYNQFETMGGKNSIVKWATQKPALANKDYIHPNAKGAEFLAQCLYNAVINDHKKYKPKSTK